MERFRVGKDPLDGSRDWREWAGAVLVLSVLLVCSILSLAFAYWLVAR